MNKNKFYRKPNFYIVAVFIALLIMPMETLPIHLAYFQNSSPPQCASRKPETVEQGKNDNMNQNKLVAVPESDWGTTDIILRVEKEAVKIEYVCAEGEINEQLKVDEQGNFTANGVHIRHKPGPIREGVAPNRQPAKYQGKISGNKMSIRITFAESGEEIGNYTLERGKTPRMQRCY